MPAFTVEYGIAAFPNSRYRKWENLADILGKIKNKNIVKFTFGNEWDAKCARSAVHNFCYENTRMARTSIRFSKTNDEVFLYVIMKPLT